MSPRTQIVKARPAHVRTIAKRMREADRIEVHAASGKTPGQALAFSLRKSSIAMTWIIDGRPELMFGVGDLNILAGVGAPWLLGTDAVLSHQMEFLRSSVEWRNKLFERYSTLKNFVDVRNEVSVRWLKWLGFSLSDPIEYRGHWFYIFELRSADVRRNDGFGDRIDARGRSRSGSAGAGNIIG